MTALLEDGGARVTAPFGHRRARLAAREEHGAYVVLRVADPDGPAPQAGQFYMLASAERWGGGADERPVVPRAFSVARAHHAGPAGPQALDFMLEAVGPGTTRLCELRPGEELLLLGPLGQGFTAPPGHADALLAGGGVGTAPLAILQDALQARPGPAGAVTALLGFRDAEHAAGAGLLTGARVATDDGSVGHHGLVTDLLEAALDTSADPVVYACGPPPMLEAVRALCERRGVPVQLALESGMACGYGACFGCVVPVRGGGYLRVCVDGPVVAGERLDTCLVAGAGH